jgi:7-carboxy-7-deazaguanine synthase
MYKVAEWFVSINGEGRRAGELAVFIRFTGCNLNCSYCDTAWAISDDSEYTEKSLDEIIEYVEKSGVKNVTLTGGEPLLRDGIEELVLELIGRDKRVEIETNGAVSIKPFYEMAQNYSLTDELSITLDYKCPGSGMEQFMLMENYDYLRPADTVKFVVCDRTDLERARQIIEKYNISDKCSAYLSPVFGNIESREIVEYMIEHRMNGVRHQLQQHKFIWPPDARGV